MQPEVANRVVAAVWKAAYLVIASQTPDAGQLAYSKTLLTCDQHSSEVQKFIRGVCANPTVQIEADAGAGNYNFAPVTDVSIDYIVATVLLPKLAI